jgi:hypothetical protein
MELLAFLSGWYHGWIAASTGRLDVRFNSSEQSLPKRSAWIEIEGAHRSGQLTLWETGEAELEVNEITSVDLVFSRSEILKNSDGLG